MEKGPKGTKKHIFGHLNPICFVIHNFFRKKSDSNDWPFFPIHSCKKLGKSLEPFWRDGQKSNLVLKIFSEKRWPMLSTTLMQNIGKIIKAVLEKRIKNLWLDRQWSIYRLTYKVGGSKNI